MDNAFETIIPQVRAEVANFVRTITDAAAEGDMDYLGQCLDNFSDFFAQSVVDGMRAGRMQSVVNSLN